MSQKILRSFGLNILHHSQKLRKENKYQVLDLIIKNRASLKSSLPGMSQSPKLCRNPLRNHHRQSMAQFDDIRNHLGILAIRLTRRVSLKFFQPLRVQRIDLYQFDSFLHQIMDQRFSISSRRFEPHYDLSQMIRYLRLRYSIPKLIKSLTIIQKFKGFYVHPIGTSPISHIRSFCKIHSNQKRFFIDDLTFSCFNSFHCYTSFQRLIPLFYHTFQSRNIFLCHAGGDLMLLQTFKTFAWLVKRGAHIFLSTIREEGDDYPPVQLHRLL